MMGPAGVAATNEPARRSLPGFGATVAATRRTAYRVPGVRLAAGLRHPELDTLAIAHVDCDASTPRREARRSRASRTNR